MGGPVISLFGDKVNQLALGAFVFKVTGENAFALALTFLAATIPNLLFSPIAGVFVDRWDKKQVLVVSDILRAALTLLVPVAVLINVWLAYPLVFLITTVSIFFRPARVAILPRIVPEEDLLSANSAMWVGETFGEVVNYPLAGLFVVFLAARCRSPSGSMPRPTCLAALPRPSSCRRWWRGHAARRGRNAAARGRGRERGRAAREAELGSTTVLATSRPAGRSCARAVLLTNTVQGTVGQIAVGIVTVAAIPLAAQLTPAARSTSHLRVHGTAIGSAT